MITAIALILTPAFGILFGVLSLIRKDGNAWLAVLCVIVNSLFALFHLLLVFFAG